MGSPQGLILSTYRKQEYRSKQEGKNSKRIGWFLRRKLNYPVSFTEHCFKQRSERGKKRS